MYASSETSEPLLAAYAVLTKISCFNAQIVLTYLVGYGKNMMQVLDFTCLYDSVLRNIADIDSILATLSQSTTCFSKGSNISYIC